MNKYKILNQTNLIYDTVRSGEGGRQLAERNGLTLEELLALNPGIETSVFYPGQSLRIK